MEQCSTKTGYMEDCGVDVEPTDNLSIFDLSVHEQIIAFVEIGGLKPSSSYKVEGKLFNTRGEMISRRTLHGKTIAAWQPNWTLDYRILWSDLPSETGTWRIDIFINGQPEMSRTFELVDSGRLGV